MSRIFLCPSDHYGAGAGAALFWLEPANLPPINAAADSLVAGLVLSLIATSFLFLGWLSSFASKWLFAVRIWSTIVNRVQFVCIAVLYAVGTIISLAGTGFLIGFVTQLKLVSGRTSIPLYPILTSSCPIIDVQTRPCRRYHRVLGHDWIDFCGSICYQNRSEPTLQVISSPRRLPHALLILPSSCVSVSLFF